MKKTTDYSKTTDEEIAVLVCQGDKEIFAQIISRYQDKLIRYANYLVRDPDTAQDVVQQSFIKAYINLNSFNTKKKFSSWIYRIVHNEAMNILGKNKWYSQFIEGVEFDSKINLEEDLERKEVVALTQNCLNQLPTKYLEPLSLFYLEDKSYEEISDILRIPINTVSTRISRAKNKMKTICQKKS